MNAWPHLALPLDAAAPTAVVEAVVHRFAEGAARPGEHPELAALEEALATGTSVAQIELRLRRLSHAGYLRGALVLLASSLQRSHRDDLALILARELMDALAPDLGVELARAVLAQPTVEVERFRENSTFRRAHHLLGEHLLERDDPHAALRHFEAVLSVDVADKRALRGWTEAQRALERRGFSVQWQSRGLALLDGLEDLQATQAFGDDRYELERPLGRGRHAIVYQAYDRRVGREVAVKRLLDPQAGSPTAHLRQLERRFFSEARTLARVRSPFVVALYDVQPRHRFIVLELCRGGNLRLALRRGVLGPAQAPGIALQLRAALEAVHVLGAVHRDIKPANILVRTGGTGHGGPMIALADFGLATDIEGSVTRVGTPRYLAPELRAGGRASPESDRFSAGVVLLELAVHPQPLPPELDRLDPNFDARSLIPADVSPTLREPLEQLLSPKPEERTWPAVP